MAGMETMGEVVTGGMMARSVEPQAGELSPDGYTAEVNCLNCRTPLVGKFCHACGQHGHVHRTIGAFFHDLLHGVLHFEGKIWRTLPLLAWQPGQLTRRYIDGERARFVSPIAIFLFSVFLMFAVFSTIGGPLSSSLDINATAQDRAEARRDFEAERALKQAELSRLREDRTVLASRQASTAAIDNKIRQTERELALGQTLFNDSMLVLGEEQNASAAKVEEPAAENSNVVIFTGASGLNAWFNDAYRKAKKNPSLLFYKLQTSAYKYSWALIPISVPFVWLLFLNRRRYRRYGGYDHTVFVTYSIAAMSLGVILLTLLRPLNLSEGLVISLMTFLPPIHMYRQLRGAYRLSRLSAAWRTVALLVFAFVAATLFGMLLLTLGVLG